MNLQLILDYLTDLSRNNRREWYHAHKAEYAEANLQFEAFLRALMDGIGQFDPGVLRYEPRDLTFKMVRDTRFSHDKSPYNPAFRAHISAQGKLPIPVGYYLMIKPGDRSFLGGGLFADLFRDATTMVRNDIAAHAEEWRAVIQAPDFQAGFEVRGSSLKNVPAGYDREHPMAEFLKMKSWYLEVPVSDRAFADPNAFLEYAVSVFRKMKPFNDLLNRALAGFQFPER